MDLFLSAILFEAASRLTVDGKLRVLNTTERRLAV